MIPNIVKGSDMRGLARYLVGPGRANEHTEPHIVGGDHFVQAFHGAELLDQAAAAELTAYLEEPRRTFGTEIRTRAWTQDGQTGERVPVLNADGQQVYRDVTTWHCSLSLPPGEVLSNEQWEKVSSDFMDRMGFTETSGKSPARWTAIHHGVSKSGNDHIHIVASMIREDGTRWDGRFRDWPAAQKACRELEEQHGLTRVTGATDGTAVRASKPAEREAAGRADRARTDREELAERLRATAVASISEAEWVRRAQDAGVVLRPYYAKGSTDVVAGYRAALKTGGTAALHFYGGGRIGHDLSLPRLRENWPEPSLEAADQASTEWQAAGRGRRTGRQGREANPLTPGSPEQAARNLQAFSRNLAAIPVSDRRAWADAARDTAGALAAWARFDPRNAEALNAAAAVIARTAQQRRPGAEPRRVRESPMGTANLLLIAARDGQTKLAGAVLMAQLLRTAAAIRDYQRAANNAREARLIQTEVISVLHQLQLRGPLYEQPRAEAVPSGKNRPPTHRNPDGESGRDPLPRQLNVRRQVAAHEERRRDDGRGR